MKEERFHDIFMKETYHKYIKFVDEASALFPKYTYLQLAREKEPDFKLLIVLIIDASVEYPGTDIDPICREIATYNERNVDKQHQKLFIDILLSECKAEYREIIENIFEKILISDLAIYEPITEIGWEYFLQEIVVSFPDEPWVLQLAKCDPDTDVMLALLFQTEAYKNQKKSVTDLCMQIALWNQSHIDEDEREDFAKRYLLDIWYAKDEVLQKFDAQIQSEIETLSTMVSLPGVFTKNPPQPQNIVVETGKKITKNKRKISENKKLIELLNKGQSFLVSMVPVHENAGIKRVIVKNSFEDVMQYIAEHLPENASIEKDGQNVKILFGRDQKKRKEKSKYQRMLVSQ